MPHLNIWKKKIKNKKESQLFIHTSIIFLGSAISMRFVGTSHTYYLTATPQTEKCLNVIIECGHKICDKKILKFVF